MKVTFWDFFFWTLMLTALGVMALYFCFYLPHKALGEYTPAEVTLLKK